MHTNFKKPIIVGAPLGHMRDLISPRGLEKGFPLFVNSRKRLTSLFKKKIVLNLKITKHWGGYCDFQKL